MTPIFLRALGANLDWSRPFFSSSRATTEKHFDFCFQALKRPSHLEVVPDTQPSHFKELSRVKDRELKGKLHDDETRVCLRNSIFDSTIDRFCLLLADFRFFY